MGVSSIVGRKSFAREDMLPGTASVPLAQSIATAQPVAAVPPPPSPSNHAGDRRLRLIDRLANPPAPRLQPQPVGSARSASAAQAPPIADPPAGNPATPPRDASGPLQQSRLTALIQAQRASIDNAARLAGTPSVTGANAGLPLSIAARAPAEIIEALAAASAAASTVAANESPAATLAGSAAGKAQSDADNAHDLLALLAETRSQAMAQAGLAPAAMHHFHDEERDERPPMIIERAQVEQLRTGPISTPLPMPAERRPAWPGLIGGAALSMLAGLAFFLWLPPA